MRCAARRRGLIQSFDTSGLPISIAAEIRDFDPKRYVANRKQLKVMCRDKLGVAAARLACRDAGIETGKIDPERFGVVLGADRICTSLDDSEPTYRVCLVDGRFDFGRWGVEGMAASFPLNFLKVLPNMTASHVSIAEDARGQNNTIHQSEASGLLADAEAASVIRRGAADAILAGGASSQLRPFDCIRHCVMGDISRRQDDPPQPCGPLTPIATAGLGRGAAVFVLEDRAMPKPRGRNPGSPAGRGLRVRSAGWWKKGPRTPPGDADRAWPGERRCKAIRPHQRPWSEHA